MSAPYIPATALGGDLVRDWTGPVDLGRDGIGTLVGLCGERRADVWRARCTTNLALSLVRLDPRRPEVAHRVADGLRARGHEVGHLLPVALSGRQGDVEAVTKCDDCGGSGGHPFGDGGDRCWTCKGSGTIRRTIPAADVSALLLAASVAGVEAGRGVVRGPATPWGQPYPSEPERWERSRPDWDGTGPRLLAGAYKDGWWVTVGGHPTAWPSGPETGPEGRAAADAALLRLGYAYLDAAAPFGVVVPTFNLENER